MHPRWFFGFRTGIGLLAGFVGIAAIWILVAELLRPRLPYFPMDISQAEIFSSAERAARIAAAVGLVRGDLWTTLAVTAATPLLFAPVGGPPTSQAGRQNARHVAERAATLAPHDARNWLILAGLGSRLPGAGKDAVEALKLSYYTGPSMFALAPLRLIVAAGMTWDEDLQGFIRLEIDRILLQRPDLKPAIAAAYKAAKPEARRAIEAILKQADPEFLATLTASPR